MLVREYLKYGSVDEVFRKSELNLPVSYAQYQRILDEWGIVKRAGPNNNLGELLNFLAKFSQENIRIDALYKKMPHTFQTSLVTIYRVLSYIKEGITRRIATGLVITPYKDENKILIANDISTPRLEFGKPFGALTIPVCFSRKRDTNEDAIMRVLQQEVFSQKAIERKIPRSLIKSSQYFMSLDIADVRVEIFHLPLPEGLSHIKNFSSFKLENFRFVGVNEILSGKMRFLREGLTEVAEGYLKFSRLSKQENLVFRPFHLRSRINYHLSESFI